MPNVAMKHEKDPRQQILEALGDISGYDIDHKEALIATYRRPEKTSGGIVLPRSNLDEDLHQSKAGLVVKIGASFHPLNSAGERYGLQIKLHDWVVIRPTEAWALEVNFVHCRMTFHDMIRARIPQPEMVW
jgi:co-chaperonin GroES (HSP10)